MGQELGPNVGFWNVEDWQPLRPGALAEKYFLPPKLRQLGELVAQRAVTPIEKLTDAEAPRIALLRSLRLSGVLSPEIS
jgi:hypothetical protein